ncbi:TPA: archaemetzincin family Zn-dependent metalloprotease [Methanocaldococcus jannaschii]|nr:archaemetzincin family Zn-dependent metalloprotease [Methanocaldococcus jannaschii]
MIMRICIQPVGDVNDEILKFLKKKFGEVFGMCEILPKIDIPIYAYNFSRGQFNSTLILKSLPTVEDIVLGVTEVDIYADNLNFVFGEAELFGKRALISLARLRPEFYGLPPNKDVLKIRALKEAIHEIGHVLGLIHCENKRCVMSFSNSIIDVDLKDWRYCKKCLKKLQDRGIYISI